jgi:hypothetical protein
MSQRVPLPISWRELATTSVLRHISSRFMQSRVENKFTLGKRTSGTPHFISFGGNETK